MVDLGGDTIPYFSLLNLPPSNGVFPMNYLSDLLNISKGRSLMYLSILLLPMGSSDALRTLQLLGLNEGDVVELSRSVKELLEVSVEDYRVDLDPVTRSLYAKVIKGFYDSVGYIVEGNPGALKAMIAFIARLASDEVRALELDDVEGARKLRVTQLRFLNAHVKPLLEGVVTRGGGLSRAAGVLLELVERDVELLKELILGAKPTDS